MMIKLDDEGNIVSSAYSVRMLKNDNPNVSFPATITEELLNSFNVYSVTTDEIPEYDNMTQTFVEDEVPTKRADGKWYIGISIVDLTEEQIEQAREMAAGQAREHRVWLISETDWWALPDSPTMTAEQTAYRQALRDITTHPNWPYLEESDWPVKPE